MGENTALSQIGVIFFLLQKLDTFIKIGMKKICKAVFLLQSNVIKLQSCSRFSTLKKSMNYHKLSWVSSTEHFSLCSISQFVCNLQSHPLFQILHSIIHSLLFVSF